LFATIEILWLAVFGIVIIPVAVPGPLIKGMIAGGLGLLFAYHGYATFSGEFRFFYILDLTPKGDLPLVPVIIGLFAIAEMLNLASKNESLSPEQESGPLGGKLREGLVAPLKNKAVTIRSAIIGTLVGVVPGIGASVANLLAYSHIAQLEKGDPPFGEGNIRGVVASEAANDSKDGGQLIPTLGLGIPGSGSTAVLLGAFIIHGIVPGPTLMTEHLSLVLVIFFALLTSNLLTSILGSLLANYLVYVTKIEIPYLYPSIIGLTIMATYVTDSSFGDVSVAVLFGLIGFAFISLNITRIPIIISLVLGSIIEVNFYNALKLGEVPWIFFQSTVSKILAVLLFVTILYALINWINDVKELNLLDR
jgi:putative tricarboxylic transport membrane protein